MVGYNITYSSDLVVSSPCGSSQALFNKYREFLRHRDANSKVVLGIAADSGLKQPRKYI